MTSTRGKHALRGIILGYLNYAASFAAALLFTPLAVRYLDPAAYGLWRTLSGSLMSYLGLLELGVGAALIRFIADYRSRQEDAQISRLVSTALGMYSILAGVVLLVSLFVAAFLGPLLNLTSELVPIGQVTLLLLGVQVAIVFLLTIFTGTIAGYERYDVVSVFMLIATVLSPVLSAILLVFGFGLVGPAIGGVIALIAAMLAAMVYVRRNIPAVHICFSLFTPQIARTTLQFSVFVFILNLGTLIITSSDNLVIARIFGLNIVAAYAIGYTLNTMAIQLTNRFSDVLLPVFTDLYSRNDRLGLHRLYLQTIRFSTALSCAFVLAIVFVGPGFITHWVGPSLFIGQTTLTLVALYTLMHGAAVHPSLVMLQSIGRVRPAAIAMLVEAGINLTLSVLLARTTLGVAGVALATVIGQACVSFWFMPLLVLRQLGISIPHYLAEGFIRPLLALLLAIPIALLITADQNPSFTAVLLQGAMIIPLYLCLFYLLASASDRQFVAQKLRTVLSA